MAIFLIPFLLLWQSTDAPYRAKEDFQVELKYDFKDRPNRETIAWESEPARIKSGPLPYLTIKLKILNPKAEEFRYKCENNLGKALFNKKADKDKVNTYDIDMGFIDDLKDHVSAYQFIVYALSEDKQVLNRIELYVSDDGTFLVNGEKRGKF